MHALDSMRSLAILGLVISLMVIAGCDTGNGPTPIPGTPPPPPPPPGTCVADITFEPECGTPRGEVPTPLNFNGGATDIIPNPDVNADNDSPTVAKMRKFPEETFGGTKFVWPGGAIDFSRGEFFKMKVWSQREVPVTFKLEEIGFPGGGFEGVETHPGGSRWITLCYDLSAQAVPTPVIEVTIIFDNGVLGQAQSDPDNWTFFYDDIEQTDSCGSPPPATPIDPDVALYSSTRDPDLVIPDDYSEVTPFGSGSVIDPMYADDESFSPVLSVWSGSGYGANVAQIGYIGFPADFLGAYETVEFKVKGMPNQVIFVKLFDNVSTLRISLTGSEFSEALAEEGWFQVQIPVARFSDVDTATGIVFESDNTSPDQFRMLLTDIGFSGTGTGGPQPPFDGGLVTNGGFEDGTSPWTAGVDAAIPESSIIDDALNPGNSVYFVNVTGSNPGAPFLVNLSQRGITITPEETYELSFRARSNVARSIIAGIGLSGGDFSNVNEAVDLTTAWQDFTLTLTATGFGDADSRVLFDLNGADGEVYIDNVRLIVAPEPPFDGGLVTNGDFEEGTSPWTAGVDAAIPESSIIDDALDPGNSVYFVNVTGSNPGAPFAVNLSQRGITITPDETYELSFRARSNVARTIIAGIGLSGGDFSNVNEAVSLTTAWQDFTLTLTATGFGDADSRVLFDLNGADGEVYIDKVRLVVSSGGGTPPPGGGTELLTNGSFETGSVDPWVDVGNGLGTVAISTTEASDGMNSVNILATTDQTVFFRQNALGAGTIANGDQIDISFDLKGLATDVPVLPELEGSGVLETITAVPTDWTTFNYSVTLGADFPGGVFFSIGVPCGAAPTCSADIFIDNVSVTLQ